MWPKLIFPELSYKIVGLCFQVHNELGRFAKEKQYGDRLEQLLKNDNIKYQREIKVPFKLADQEIKGNIADFFIDDKIILECKAKRMVSREDYKQLQRYLKAADISLGIIVNFHEKFLKSKRIINFQK